MSNQRPSFAKRDREQKLKDKARAKAERRAAKRAGIKLPGDSDDQASDSDLGPDANGADTSTGETLVAAPAPAAQSTTGSS